MLERRDDAGADRLDRDSADGPAGAVGPCPRHVDGRGSGFRAGAAVGLDAREQIPLFGLTGTGDQVLIQSIHRDDAEDQFVRRRADRDSAVRVIARCRSEGAQRRCLIDIGESHHADIRVTSAAERHDDVERADRGGNQREDFDSSSIRRHHEPFRRQLAAVIGDRADRRRKIFPDGHADQHQSIAAGSGVGNVQRRSRRRSGRGRVYGNVQQMPPVVLSVLTERDLRFDLPRRVFQVPVCSKDGVTGVVVTGGHIGLSQCTDRIDQLLPIGTGGQITAVEQQVGIGRECIRPAGDLSGVAAQVVLSQPCRAELDRGVGAVRHNMHGIDASAPSQRFGDLLDAVTRVLQQHDFEFTRGIVVRPQVIQKLLVVVDARVDKDEFLADGLI